MCGVFCVCHAGFLVILCSGFSVCASSKTLQSSSPALKGLHIPSFCPLWPRRWHDIFCTLLSCIGRLLRALESLVQAYAWWWFCRNFRRERKKERQRGREIKHLISEEINWRVSRYFIQSKSNPLCDLCGWEELWGEIYTQGSPFPSNHGDETTFLESDDTKHLIVCNVLQNDLHPCKNHSAQCFHVVD